MTDRIVPIAIIYSRSEAMVVASLLDAAGILVHVGGYHHNSVSASQVALGGYRFTVPEFQHEEASRVIASTPGFGENSFSYALQQAVVKVMILWALIFGLPMSLAMIIIEEGSPLPILLMPLSMLTIPANPQGHSDYFLSLLDEA